MAIFGQKNHKMNITSSENELFINFDLPATDNICICAGACKNGCYARQGRYVFGTIKKHLDDNYKLTLRPDFVETVHKELTKTKYAKYRVDGKKLYVRIHASGEFYSKQYMYNWIKIARLNPDVTFYAYTKQVKMYHDAKQDIPANMRFILSYGGTEDKYINDDDVVAMVVKDSVPNGWADGSISDKVALENDKIALIYHGSKKYENTNWDKVDKKN